MFVLALPRTLIRYSYGIAKKRNERDIAIERFYIYMYRETTVNHERGNGSKAAELNQTPLKYQILSLNNPC